MNSEHFSDDVAEHLADNLADNLAEQPVNSPGTHVKAQALVIGAGSAIAAALINKMIHQHSVSGIVAVSRQPPEGAGLPQDSHDVPVSYLSCDYTAAGISDVAGQLNGPFSHVFICTGVLHIGKELIIKVILNHAVNVMRQYPITVISAEIPHVKG
jgi:hypothetical protein